MDRVLIAKLLIIIFQFYKTLIFCNFTDRWLSFYTWDYSERSFRKLPGKFRAIPSFYYS